MAGNAPANRPIFLHDDDTPVKFYFMNRPDPDKISPDQVAIPEQQIAELREKILANGGTICALRRECEVLIVNAEAIDKYRQYYAFHKHISPEKPSFIDQCIKKGLYDRKLPQKKAMGGRPGKLTNERKEFTAEEEHLLAEYLAVRVPHIEAGGRMGIGVYKELEESGKEFPHGPWGLGKNHPWQSWRNKYAKNQEAFNAAIDVIVARDPPAPDGKGTYWLDRRLAPNYAGGYNLRWHVDDEEEGEFELDLDDEELYQFEEEEEENFIKQEPEVIDLTEDSEADASRQRGKKRAASDQFSASYNRPVKKARIASRSGRKEGSFVLGDVDLDWALNNFEQPPQPKAGPSGTQHNRLASNPRTPDPSRVPKEDPSPSVGKSASGVGEPARPRPQAARVGARDSGPMSSQITLVNPTQGRRARAPSPPSRELRPRKPVSVSAAAPSEPKSPSRPVTRQQQAAVKAEPEVASRPQTRSLAKASTSSNQQGPGFPGKVRVKPEVVVPRRKSDAPFRHTRSRSRSVEPQTKTRLTRADKGKARMQALDEEAERAEIKSDPEADEEEELVNMEEDDADALRHVLKQEEEDDEETQLLDELESPVKNFKKEEEEEESDEGENEERERDSDEQESDEKEESEESGDEQESGDDDEDEDAEQDEPRDSSEEKVTEMVTPRRTRRMPRRSTE